MYFITIFPFKTHKHLPKICIAYREMHAMWQMLVRYTDVRKTDCYTVTVFKGWLIGGVSTVCSCMSMLLLPPTISRDNLPAVLRPTLQVVDDVGRDDAILLDWRLPPQLHTTRSQEGPLQHHWRQQDTGQR